MKREVRYGEVYVEKQVKAVMMALGTQTGPDPDVLVLHETEPSMPVKDGHLTTMDIDEIKHWDQVE